MCMFLRVYLCMSVCFYVRLLCGLRVSCAQMSSFAVTAIASNGCYSETNYSLLLTSCTNLIYEVDMLLYEYKLDL
jgi:hypothetical protein